ncbi:MAG TPA: hypothetical protein VN690_11740 [Terriglobales bacterium]|nr:hypothetical protein [Terriglobales bacterium]
MHAHEETITVQNPGPAVFAPKVRSLLMAATVIGVVVFAAALAIDPQRAWYSFLTNYLFFTVLGVGGVFLVALEYITSATWTVVFRRLPEAAASYLPAALLLGIVLLIGVPHIYPWAVAGFAGFITHGKRVYFAMPFYSARTLIALGVWTFFGWWFLRNSTAQDTNPATLVPRKTFGKPPTVRGRVAAGFLVFFGYSFTWCFVDWIMSLEPKWSTTMWGVYGFAGLFQASLALVLLFTVLFRRRQMFGGAVRDYHYVDLARIVHAFSIFMVYIGFAQYLLIWYANFREETVFFHERIVHGWGWIFMFLLFAKWVLPFCILMNQKIRTNETVLIWMSSLILVAEWFDCYWLVMPPIHTSFYIPNWVELGVFLGFLGIFGLLYTRYLSRHPMVPIGDPKFLNSVAGRYL